ncbi:hypothetical protein PR202_ga27914 [Eleusine coracana subsp. coracana]|uniref:Uncharacterized protein n=1 Tax=Eleusine coracana subsp. coracana TaxID=191504 RepID=A0AAV5DG00_ELECO|nr:hypothetical protein PR202_ga27914 [Eleusine coracana subsp. coracana]
MTTYVIAQCQASAACTLLGKLGSTEHYAPVSEDRTCSACSRPATRARGGRCFADVRRHNMSIEAVLRAIRPATVEQMREEVIRLIPRDDPRAPKLEMLKDAFRSKS